MSEENVAFRLSEPKGPAGITRHTSPIPSPKAHEVLVRIHAVSLNFRDFAVAHGLYPLPTKEQPVMGSDMAGEVIEVGEGVTEWKVGDRVTANFDPTHFFGPQTTWTGGLGAPIDGVLQKYRTFEPNGLLPIPAHLSYEEAACWPCAGVTAWNALYGGIPLKPGQTVLFQGTGGVSIMGLLLASKAGAKTIITSSSEEKLALAKKLGATYTINYKTTSDWDKEVMKLTNNRGADHIFDNVGINEIERCFNCVAPGGSISAIGFLGGEPKAQPNVPMLALVKGASLRGINVGSKQLHEEMLTFVSTNGIKPHIDKVFPFEKTAEAVEYLGKGQHSGKIVIKVVE